MAGGHSSALTDLVDDSPGGIDKRHRWQRALGARGPDPRSLLGEQQRSELALEDVHAVGLADQHLPSGFSNGDEHRNLLKSGPASTLREVRRGLEAVAEASGQPAALVPAAVRGAVGDGAARGAVAAATTRALDHLREQLGPGGHAGVGGRRGTGRSGSGGRRSCCTTRPTTPARTPGAPPLARFRCWRPTSTRPAWLSARSPSTTPGPRVVLLGGCGLQGRRRAERRLGRLGQELPLVEPRVQAAQLYELGVGALLDQATVVKDEDQVGGQDGGEPVRDH